MTQPKEPAMPADILVVDDTPANLQLLAAMLKERGHKVRPVLNGKLALQAARHAPPEIILLDINMPEMDGYEVCAEMKADSRLAEIPIIFISANAETMDKVRAFAIGGVDYVTKPFQFDEVEARVETHIKIRRLQARLHRSNEQLRALNQLATNLTAAKTLEQFASILQSACHTLVGGKAFLMSGDPHTGGLTLPAEENPTLRVKHKNAAFLAANQKRVITIGRDAELQPSYEVTEGVHLDSGLVAPLTTPYGETAGVLVVEFDPKERPSPDSQDEATVLAVSNLSAPILATLVRSWTQEKVMKALREILLPEAIPQPEGLEVYACFEPVEAPSMLGGDYYDVLPLGEHTWGFAIGDVTGHGLDAGRYTAMAKYVVRSFALEYRSPAKTISQADRTLAAQMDELHFATIFFAVLDMRQNDLTYCCAGHPPGLLYSPASESLRELRVGGGLVGSDLSIGFEEERINLQAGDMLLLYTDGIMEARRGDEEYGTQRLETAVRENAGRSLKNIARAVIDDVRDFAQNLVRDDMALLLVRVPERPDGDS